MTPDHSPSLYWRSQIQRYRLLGEKLATGEVFFTQKGKYHTPDCKMKATFLGIATVKAVYNHEGSDEKEIELAFFDKKKLKLSLNGLSHSFKFEVNMNLNVFKEKTESGELQYSVRPITSSSSK